MWKKILPMTACSSHQDRVSAAHRCNANQVARDTFIIVSINLQGGTTGLQARPETCTPAIFLCDFLVTSGLQAVDAGFWHCPPWPWRGRKRKARPEGVIGASRLLGTQACNLHAERERPRPSGRKSHGNCRTLCKTKIRVGKLLRG